MKPFSKTYTVVSVVACGMGTVLVTADVEGYQMHSHSDPERLTYRLLSSEAPQVGEVLTVSVTLTGQSEYE